MSSEVRDRRDLGTFIPSYLDDYPLTPDEFRLYAHIARRAGKNGCFESIPNMAKHCHICEKHTRKALRSLLSYRLIVEIPRSGKTSIYELTNQEEWVEPTQIERTPSKKGGATPGNNATSTPGNNATSTPGNNATSTPGNNATSTPGNNATTPLAIMPDEGSTSKGIPIKGIPIKENTNQDACAENAAFEILIPEQQELNEEEEFLNLIASLNKKPELNNNNQQPSQEPNIPALALKTSAGIDSTHGVGKTELRFRDRYLSDAEVREYAEVWNKLKPDCCLLCPKLDSRTKMRVREIAKDFSPMEFGGAVCAMRESPQGEYYRKQQFTFFRLIDNGHIAKLFGVHSHLWDTDGGYRARVSGEEETIVETRPTDEEMLEFVRNNMLKKKGA